MNQGTLSASSSTSTDTATNTPAKTVCIIGYAPYTGAAFGGGLITRDLITLYRDLGRHVRYVGYGVKSGWTRADRTDLSVDLGLDSMSIGRTRFTSLLPGELQRLIFYPLSLRRNRAKIFGGVDTIHTTIPSALPVWYCIRPKKRVIISYLENISLFESSLVARAFERVRKCVFGLHARKADAITVVSDYLYEQCSRTATIVTCIYDYTTFTPYTASSTGPALPVLKKNGPYSILVPQRMSRQKSVQTMIHALGTIKKNSPALINQFHCTLLGSGGYRKHCERLTATYGLQDSITIVDYIDHAQMESYLSTFDAVVLTTLNEGGQPSLIAIEAITLGVPLIMSDASDRMNQRFTPDEMYPAGDAQALADILTDCLNNGFADYQFSLDRIAEYTYEDARFRWTTLIGS